MKNLNYHIFLITTFLAVTINAQFGISAKGGAYIPVGEFTKNYNNGYGGEFTLIYRANPKFELGITSGYSSYGADEEVLNERIYEEYQEIIDNINLPGTIDSEAPLNVIPLTLNIKYLFGNKKFKPYFFFEGGIFFYDINTTAKFDVTNGPTIDIVETTQEDNSTMLGIGGGLQFRITKKLFLDVAAKWSIMNNIRLVEADVNEELSGVDRTAQTIGILAGLSYNF